MKPSTLLAMALSLLMPTTPSPARQQKADCLSSLPINATMELFVEPLRLQSVTLRLETGRFEPTQTPQRFTVHVQDSSNEENVDVLTVHVDVEEDRLIFLGVSGPGLSRQPAEGPPEVMARTAAFLRRVSGWRALPDVIPGPTPDRTLRRFVSSGPGGEAQIWTGVFQSLSGIPLVIGVPGPPQY